MKKRWMKTIGMFLSMAILLSSVAASTVVLGATVPDSKGGLYEIEAEKVTIHSNYSEISDPAMSGGKALNTTVAALDQPAKDAPGDLTFSFKADQDGTYVLWARVRPTTSSKAVWVSMGGNYASCKLGGENGKLFWAKLTSSDAVKAGDTVTVKLITSNGYFDLDKFVLSNDIFYSPDGSSDGASTIKVVEAGDYPDIIDKSTIGTVKPFEKGDRVVFIGDSITHGGSYHADMMAYYATRYPDSQFTYINSGINGNRAVNVLARLEADIFSNKFNKAVIMLGMNDMNRVQYYTGVEGSPEQTTAREKQAATYKSGLQQLVDTLKAKSIPIVIAAPSFFDETVPQSNNTNFPGYNAILRQAGCYIKGWAPTQGLEFVDFNTPMVLANTFLQQKDPNLTLNKDRVHPGNTGHYVMAYSLLKAMGANSEISTVEIDATGAKISKAANCTVDDLAATDSKVNYVYNPKSLPMPVCAAYQEALQVIPLTTELNQEMIKINGLKSGSYKITMNGKDVLKANSSDLAKGVNIAALATNPQQIQSLMVKTLIDQKKAAELKIRDLRQTEEGYISSYKWTVTSYDQVKKNVEELLARTGAESINADTAAKLKVYLENKANEPGLVEQIATAEKKVYEINKPKQYKVSIEYLGAEDAALAINGTTKIVPAKVPEGMMPMVANYDPAIDGPVQEPKDMEGHWAREIVKTLVEKRIVDGDQNGNFNPDNNVNIDEFIKMTVCALGNKVEVGNDYWASTYIAKAKELGLILEGEFASYDRPINRYEMARMIMRGLKEAPASNLVAIAKEIPDYDQIPESEQDFVVNAYAKGIIAGLEDRRFGGSQNATRAEAATVILRLIDPSYRRPADIRSRPGGNGTLPIADCEWNDHYLQETGYKSYDGDVSTVWSAEGDSRYVIYDLGADYTVKGVGITWNKGDQRQAIFEILVSSDKSNFIQLFNGKASGKNAGNEDFVFKEPVKARYIKILCHGNTASMWNAIKEIVFYGE